MPEEHDAGKTWGKGNYPQPRGAGLIECDEMKCTGCGICQMACSMRHFGVVNKDLARIQVRNLRMGTESRSWRLSQEVDSAVLSGVTPFLSRLAYP